MTEIDASPEERVVIQWTVEHLVDRGVTVLDALALAEARVSWHDVEALLAKGCPPDLVRRILG